MSKISLRMQEANQLVKGFAPKVQNKLKEMFYGIQTGEPKLVQDAARAIAEMNIMPVLTSAEQKETLAKVWVTVLQEAYENSAPPDFSLYLPILDCFSRYFAASEDLPGVFAHLPFPFEITEQFLWCCYDEQRGDDPALMLDEVYVSHLRALMPIVKTEGFRRWIGEDASGVLFSGLLKRWVGHLGVLLMQRRREPFLALLELFILILAIRPEWKASYEEAFRLPPFFADAFFLDAAEGENPVEALAKRIHADLPLEGKTILSDLLTKCQEGVRQTIAEAKKAAEPEELTVETALRIALEEIMGDGVISTEENRIMQSLREYLGIDHEVFQTIFNAVAQEKQARQIEDLDRDFNAEEFLYRVIQKAAEDGVITNDEKAILRKIGHALTLEQDMFNRALERVKSERREKTGGTSGLLQEVAGTFALAGLVKQVFNGPKAQASLARSGELFRTFRRKLEVRSPGKADDILGKTVSITDFFYEPHLYTLPVLGIMVDGRAIHPMRLQLIGRQLIAFFNQPVREMAEKSLTCANGEALTILNRWTDNRVRLHQVFLDEALNRFVEGLGQSKGRFCLALIHYSTLSPYLVVPMDGGLDTEGKLAPAWGFLTAGKYGEAAGLLEDLRKKQTTLFHVAALLGTCYRLLGQNRVDPETNYPRAMTCFERELELNPDSSEAMAGIGVIYKLQNNWKKAADWLEKARQVSPGSLSVLGTLASVRYQLDPRKGQYQGEVPEYLLSLLGTMYQVNSRHPEFLRTVESFAKDCKVDLLHKLRLLPLPGDIR